ncbi:MAG: hypothetical protein HQL22_06055 [Candidatus Omnitrophica bacterium]|nr:hypothetical protein [Candidatus Omnitrophota bacterium]
MNSYISLAVYLVFLFVGLIFILKNVVRLYKEVARAEELLSVAGMEAVESRQLIDQQKAEYERLKIELERKSNDLFSKDAEIQRALGEANQFKVELQVKVNELTIKDQEISLMAVELESLKAKQKSEAGRSSQDNDVKAQTSQLKNELSVKIQEAQALQAELLRKDQEIKAKFDEGAARGKEIQRLNGELAEKDSEIKRLTQALGQTENRQQEESANAAEIAARDQKIQAQLQEYADSLARLKEELAQKEQDRQHLAIELANEQEAAVSAGDSAAKDQEILALKGEIDGLKGELPKYQAQLKEYTESFARLKEELAQKELERQQLKISLDTRISDLAEKELEVKRLTLEMGKLDSRQQESAASAGLVAEKEKELEQLNSEFQQAVEASKKFKDVLESKVSELAEKEREVQRLTETVGGFQSNFGDLERLKAECQSYDERVGKLKGAEPAISQLERALDEERHELRLVKMRAQESKMKLDLLGDKTKEAVESIARFAEGKEFEEFRKSIHMDQTVQKYEDEIKGLKIKILELEKT